MDNPTLNKGLYYHDPDGYSDNYYYDNNNYNNSQYGDFFNIDKQTGFLMIGIILYISCCCFRGLNRAERDSDLHVRLTQEQTVSPRVVNEIKKNIVDPKIMNKETVCSICLEDFDETKEIVFLDCNHIYHSDCIIEWINKDPSCPLCRSNSLV